LVADTLTSKRETLRALVAARDQAVAANRPGQVIDYNRLIYLLKAEMENLDDVLNMWLKFAGY
jgi:hypothetical protein